MSTGRTLGDRRDSRERRGGSRDRRNGQRERRAKKDANFAGPNKRTVDRRNLDRRSERNVQALVDAPGANVKKKRKARFGASKRLECVAMFARQLFVLVSCGTPVVQGLQALERQADQPEWGRILKEIRRKVEEGDTLADAMNGHERFFDPVTRTLISAGEASGNLGGMLDRVALLTEQQLEIRRSVIGALMYPIILLFVAVSAFGVMMVLVLPKFAGLFETLDMPLPPTTKILVGMSDVLIGYWWAMLISLIAAGFGARAYKKSAKGKEVIDQLILATPKIGNIVRSFTMARITRLLGVLIESHVPMLEAIALTRGATSNLRYQKLLTDSEDIVRRGEPLSTAFSGTDLVAPSTSEAIRSGEQAGQVGSLLLNIAEFGDNDNRTVIKSLTSIIEPFVLIILGVLIGIVAISLFLPMFDLAASTRG